MVLVTSLRRSPVDVLTRKRICRLNEPALKGLPRRVSFPVQFAALTVRQSAVLATVVAGRRGHLPSQSIPNVAATSFIYVLYSFVFPSDVWFSHLLADLELMGSMSVSERQSGWP